MAVKPMNNVTTIATGEDNRYKKIHSDKDSVAPGTGAGSQALGQKKVQDAHLNNLLNRLDKGEVKKEAETQVAQKQLNTGKVASDPSKPDGMKVSQEQYQTVKEQASKLNSLTTTGTIPKADGKGEAANSNTNAQTSFQQAQSGGQTQYQKVQSNPIQQNIAAMAQGVSGGKPLADQGLKQPAVHDQSKGTEASLKNGAKVVQNEAVSQTKGTESAKTTLTGEQAHQQLATLQAGQAAVASSMQGVKKTEQPAAESVDDSKEPEEDGKEDGKTQKSAWSAASGAARNLRRMTQDGLGAGGGSGSEDNGQALDISANMISEVDGDPLGRIERSGAEVGVQIVSPTVEELPAAEARLTAVKYDMDVVKAQRQALTLDEIMNYNRPDQKLVERIIADTNEAIEEARRFLNTGRTNAYGMMSA